MEDDAMLSAVAHALAHPMRIRILRLLSAQPECSGTAVFSEIPLAQSTVSEHLRVLKDAGLVKAHSVGTGMVYCIDAGSLAPLAGLLAELTCQSPVCDPEERTDNA